MNSGAEINQLNVHCRIALILGILLVTIVNELILAAGAVFDILNPCLKYDL